MLISLRVASVVAAFSTTLRISLAGYRPYQTDLYIPSDFECRLAVILKKMQAKSDAAP